MRNSTGSVKLLIEQLVRSLKLRDWEDSYLDQAMENRKLLMSQIVRGGESSVDLLLELLVHSDWAVRKDAVLMLGHIKHKRAVQPLLTTMLNDESIAVRKNAASALERIGTQEAILAVQAWYRDNRISAQERIQQKISEYMTYGETDEALIRRASELAAQKKVSIKDILKARLFMTGEKPPLTPEQERDFYRSLGIIELTAEDCMYLDDLYKVS